MKRRHVLIGTIAVVGILLLAACPNPTNSDGGGSITIEVTGLTLNRSVPLALAVGDQTQLQAIMSPTNANTGITWSSGSTSVATVSTNGLVTAVALGSTTISVASELDANINDSVTVNVVDSIADLQGFAILNQDKADEAVVDPGNTTTVPGLVDGKVSIVNNHTETGEAGLNSSGIAGYTILYYDQPFEGNFRISARLRFYDGAAGTSRGIALGAFGVPDGGSFGDTDTPVAVMYHRDNGTEVRSFWTKDPGGNGVGDPRIDPAIFEYIFEVERTESAYVFRVYNSQTEALISENTVSNAPEGSNAGLVSQLHYGEPVYLGFAAGGASMEISNIKIFELGSTPVFETEEVAGSAVPVTDVTLSGPELNADDTYDYQTSLSVAEADTITLTATVIPAEADDTSVTWSSSNTDVATVTASVDNEQEATVTVVGAGQATITVTTVDGDWTDTYALNISAGSVPVSTISIDGAATVMVGLTTPLTATVAPTNATVQDLTWSSSNETVATVDQDGLVTGVGTGNAVITAEATDGSGIEGTHNINVSDAESVIWSWTAGPDAATFVIDSSSPETVVDGITLRRWGGTVTATAEGITMSNARFVIGSASTTATTSEIYDENGQLNLSTSARLTVQFEAWDGPDAPTGVTNPRLSHAYLNNNTTGQDNSVLGAVSRLTIASTTTSPVVIDLNPADFGDHVSLSTAFLHLRADSGSAVRITGIVLEYVD